MNFQSSPLPKLRTYDHPEANGRQPLEGEHSYQMRFVLEGGATATVEFGQVGFDAISQMVLDMLAEAPSYSDGSFNPEQREAIADGFTRLRDERDRLLKENEKMRKIFRDGGINDPLK